MTKSGISSTEGCTPGTVSADTTGATYTCAATSAGGTATESVVIRRDATRPTSIATPVPAPNAADWNNTDVTVTFSGADGPIGSGIATCTVPRVLAGEGLFSGVQGFCTDAAGNDSSNTAVAPNIRIDRTPPSASITTPASNAEYAVGAVVTAGYGCSDGLSGVGTCAGTVATGAAIDTIATGVKSFAVTATDAAGNTSTVTHNYTVTVVIPPVVAGNDSASTNQGEAVSVAVLSNDSGGGGALSVSAVTQGTNGTVTIDGTSVTYTPEASFFGTDSFTYTVTDGLTSASAR